MDAITTTWTLCETEAKMNKETADVCERSRQPVPETAWFDGITML